MADRRDVAALGEHLTRLLQLAQDYAYVGVT
jgi:hypothetical protein